jgi:hypothetical protein
MIRLRLVLSFLVLLALAANQPCFAREAHAQHRAPGAAANNGATAKGASANSTNPTAARSLNLEPPAPPVLPRRATHQAKQNTNIKIIPPKNRTRNLQTGSPNAPNLHNAIGQRVVAPKNFVGGRPPLPAQQTTRAGSPIIYGAPWVRSNLARPNTPNANIATLNNRSNRTSIGTGVIRPATPPSGVGGPARMTYGINGTAVQNRR